MVREVTVSVPAFIAERRYRTPESQVPFYEEVRYELTLLDAALGPHSTSVESRPTISSFLLRTEAVASSRIEGHNPSLDELAKASIGLKSTQDATMTWAAARALDDMVTAAGDTRRIELHDILTAHRRLMKDDSLDGRHAGQFREVQNWIGGSDHSPRNAHHVPPPPELVADLMDDLVAFCNRDDLPAVAQAAIAHAQFESIHPFTDGNGRVGRALISAILRRRDLATRSVVPIASAMLADVSSYFGFLDAYRSGEIDPFIDYLGRAIIRAAVEARASAITLWELPAEWRARARPRGGSAVDKIIETLVMQPVIDAERAIRRTGVSSSAAYDALNRLTEAGILHRINLSERDRAWAATDVMEEIARLNDRLRNP